MGKRITIRSGKNKGMKLQKWVCEKIANIFGVIFDNQDDQCLLHSRECGLSGKDIIIRKPLYDIFSFDVECKNTEKINLYKDIEQAINNTEPNRDWLIVHKKNRSEPIVIMDWNSFEKLIKKIEKLKKEVIKDSIKNHIEELIDER